jgi:hypothetical protein
MKLRGYKTIVLAGMCLVMGLKAYADHSPIPMVTLIAPITGGSPAGADSTCDKSAFRKKMQQFQDRMSEFQEHLAAIHGSNFLKEHNDLTEAFNRQLTDMNESLEQNVSPFGISDSELAEKLGNGEAKLKSKTYSRTYPVTDHDLLRIDNRYGKITVNTWDRNEFKVDVEIKAYAGNDADAQKLLDAVKIDANKNNAGISFSTIIGSDFKDNFWGALLNKTGIRKTVINYTVYMPANNPLTIANSYGAIVLPELSGKVAIRNDYGNLTSRALTNAGNSIVIYYGNADIESFSGSNLQVSYGSLNLQWVDKLNADISYSQVRIGKISTSANINMHYGEGLQIASLDKNLRNLSVNASYTPVKIGKLNNDDANFDVAIYGGGFSYDDGINILSKTSSGNHWSMAQNYKGHIGKGNDDRLIVIRSKYSNVKFDQ